MINFDRRGVRGYTDLLPVMIVALAGALLSIIVFVVIRNYYIESDQRKFEEDASYYSSGFKSAIDRHVASLSAIHAFVSASHAVNRWEFSSFAHQILPQNSGFKAVVWLPRLTKGQRSAFEASLKKDGLYGLELRDALPSGRLVVAPKREDYLPVAFVEPFESSGDLIGVDLRRNSMYRRLFENANRSGKQEASPPLTQALVQGATPPLVLVAFPLINSAHAPSHAQVMAPEGYVLGILQLQGVVNSSVGERASVQAAIAYGDFADLTVLPAVPNGIKTNKSSWAQSAEFYRQMPFHVAGQQFYLLLRSASQGKPLTRFYVPLGAMLLVLALTALLGQSLALTVLGKREVEKAVVERTSELQELNHALRDEIEQRRHAETSLVMARDNAESANRAKSAFLSTMSHELRTPLNAIIGFSSILAGGDEAFQAKSEEYLREINSSGVKLLNLINDILEITQMDSHAQNTNDLISFTDLVEAVKSKVSPLAEEAGVTFETNVAPKLPLLSGDGRRLQRALFHLLSNSVKFGGRGCVATLSVRDCLDSVEIEVSDNGAGMDCPSDIAGFFSQADRSLARRHEGVGIGLTYVRRAAEQHEAAVRIESEAGRGTTVILSFPLRRVARDLEVA